MRADRADITSPRDLDGKTYGGFGAAYEVPKMQAVISDAGGNGQFTTVVLGTAAYEALYAGQVDFTEPFVTWEGIEAQLRGQPLKTFDYTDYGFPDAYNVLLIGNGTWLQAHPDQARAFVQAVQRGYQLAADDPAKGAELLEKANPGAFTEPELVSRSQQLLSERYLRDESGAVGPQTLEKWNGFSGFLYETGTLVGTGRQAADGAPRLRDLVHRPVPGHAVTRASPQRPTPPGVGGGAGGPASDGARAAGRAPASAAGWPCCHSGRSRATTAASPPGARPRPPVTRGARGVRRALVAGLPSLVLVAVGLIAWQWLVTASGVRPQVLPSPLRVAEQGWAAREQIWANTVPTLQVTAVGFAVSLALGWVIAIAVDFSPWLRRALTPLLVASQTLPIIAIAPLLIIWFGFGLLPKVVVIALVTFFPVAIGLIEGFASTPRAATNLLRSMGASRWQRFRLVRLPQAMPSFFTALRIGITYAVTGAIFAEYVGATAGLGIYMSLQKNSFRTDLVLAAVVVTAVLSVTLFALTFVVQRLVIPWHRRG